MITRLASCVLDVDVHAPEGFKAATGTLAMPKKTDGQIGLPASRLKD